MARGDLAVIVAVGAVELSVGILCVLIPVVLAVIVWASK